MEITFSTDKKLVSWKYRGNVIEKNFTYPVVDAVCNLSKEVFIVASYKEVEDNRNVFLFDVKGKEKGRLPIPFEDIRVRSFDGVDVNEDGTLTFYLDTLSEGYDWETRIKYNPKTKTFFDRNRCK